jgi:hypothetical protein
VVAAVQLGLHGFPCLREEGLAAIAAVSTLVALDLRSCPEVRDLMRFIMLCVDHLTPANADGCCQLVLTPWQPCPSPPFDTGFVPDRDFA